MPDNSGNVLDPIAVFVDSKTPLNFNTQLTLMNGFPFDTSDDSVDEIMNRFGFVHKGHAYAKNELSTTLNKIILYPAGIIRKGCKTSRHQDRSKKQIRRSKRAGNRANLDGKA